VIPPLELTPRVAALHEEVRSARPALCSERAVLVTRFCRRRANRKRPAVLVRAGALAHVLRNKRVTIHPGELLVGNYTAHRVGGGLLPELHGVAMLEDLHAFPRRAVNPLTVAPDDRRLLLREVLPFWATRMLPLHALPKWETPRFLREQLSPTSYLINETGGVSHVVPDYAGLLRRGTAGLSEEAAARLAETPPGSDAAHFLEAVRVVCDGLEAFAAAYAREAGRLAGAEGDPARRAELEAIAAACARVPAGPARTFQEALQAILLAQIALNLESLDHSVCPGRLDQVLAPFYDADVEAGRLTREAAFELLGCFAVKLCEIVPVYSRRLTRLHGGLSNGQVVVVGGTDAEGRDATHGVSWLLLELMDRLRTRQPNYHARLHAGSPPAWRARCAAVLAGGAASPALYNDEVIVPLLVGRGVQEAHARDYAAVGCVEPVPVGRAFYSTDAALFNVPLCLELALNGGRRFGRRRRTGAATPPPADCGSAEEVLALFRRQLEHGIRRLLHDLRAVERANARRHPTPLTSALLDGCLEAARDASAGGTRYNGSGVQGVGVVEVGDSLAALDAVVFRERRATLADVVAACRRGFSGDEALRARLRRAPKYGNDDPAADRWTGRVLEAYADCLQAEDNTRGGRYAAGFYSVTAHVAFGEVVGALPSGRTGGEPFSSGLSPSNGADRRGPTATLLSCASLPLARAENGANFNLKLAPWLVAGEEGPAALEALIAGGFSAGNMQLQVNVVDPQVLMEARAHPGRHPGLVVRVSGYSAYFDDLSPAVQQEIIDRTLAESG